jgi:hypothetical protein
MGNSQNRTHKALQLSSTADGHSTVAGVAHPRCLFDKPATSAVRDGAQLCILANMMSRPWQLSRPADEASDTWNTQTKPLRYAVRGNM